METVYVLKPIIFIKKRKRHKDDYQPFILDGPFTGIYKTQKNAEDAIHDMIHRDSYDDWYCFYIHEFPIDHISFVHNESLHTWLYDPQGSLIDERPYPTYTFGNYFKGRPASKIRFKIGDVVEYHSRLGIISALPSEQLNFVSDETDDSYMMLYLDQDFEDPNCTWHTHPECIHVMKPRFPISDKVQQQIDKVKKFYII